jgi:hypothetical protein
MGKSLRLILLVLLGLLGACGGATNYNSASGGGGSNSAVVQGTWSGTLDITGSSSSSSVIYAAIEQGGQAFFYDQDGVIYVLPQFTGNTTLTGTVIAYAPAGSTFGSSGTNHETFSVTASVSADSITGSFTGNGVTGNFSLTPFTSFNANPSIVAGNWQGFYVGSGSAALALTVQAGGAFVGTDSNGCNLNGNLTQVVSGGTAAQTPAPLFDVSVDSTGSNCLGQLTGLAFESDSDASGLFGGTTGTYYYVGVSNASGAFIAELKVQ